jgi:hypothetical protein
MPRTLVAVRIILCVAITALAAGSMRAVEKPLMVDVAFEGGSGLVQNISQDERLIRIVPTPHQNRGWQCWWYVKISGITPGERITLDVGPAPWATPDRATFSVDNKTWRHTAPGTRGGKRIVYQQQVDAAEAWFAWGPPFVPSDAKRLVESVAAAHDFATAIELCKTRDERSVPALRVAQPTGDAPPLGIWIQARQHAWESGSSWVCRGFVEWLVSGDPRAEALRRQASITVVPIMDIDNTAIGAGGKQQKPQDHNRDWSDEPHWPSVAAAQKEIKRLDDADRFDLFVDLHNPGAGDRAPFFFVPPDELLSPLGRRNLTAFFLAAQTEITGPLRLQNKTRTSGANYDRRWMQISKNWVAANTAEHVVAVTLETSWNHPASSVDGYLTVGRQLGLAIERYFRTSPRAAITELGTE